MNTLQKNNFTVVSLFSGTGGSSLGYTLADGKVLLAVEFDDNAAKNYKLNFPNTTLFHGDIKNLTNDKVLKLTNLKPNELDILDGSPPCQGFSTNGAREMKDERNHLFIEYIRILNLLKPKVFVMENVSGMVKGKMKILFVEILKALKECGYNVKAKLLNAKYYNVPQARERLFFIGVRNDLNKEPIFPIANNKIITVKEALENCPISEVPLFKDNYAKLWDKIPYGKSSQYVLKTKGYNSCLKIDPNKPSCTIIKTQTGRGFATLAHWKEPRAMSVSEAKRLCSFPDDFKLVGTYSEQWARLGNAVMPNQMKAIAETIKDKILYGT